MFQKLESTDFDEKKEINKRKQLILEGKASAHLFLFLAHLSKVKFNVTTTMKQHKIKLELFLCPGMYVYLDFSL